MPEPGLGRSLLALGVALVVTFSAAWIGTSFPPGEWHAALVKPSWNPPNWVFGPVWTVLYTGMAVAAWMVWKTGAPGVNVAIAFYGAQLALNAAWSWLFFGLHRMDLALLDIIGLWVLAAVTCILFWRLRPAAGLLFVPYLAWLAFATLLNATLWRLNP